ncbi:MAG TPA: FAD-dependent oxidoreductase, partial [Thermomicrobiales bacterium]|nr:FAD-dependent oxidoreductase [Thermomicrobiales bacterium]
MSQYDYLIVGGGMAADAAIRGIREVDPDGAIGLIGAEADPPYKRPSLSKALWRGKPLASVWLDTAARDVDLSLGRVATRLDLARRIVTDDRGADYAFAKLLLATGGAPRRLPFGG